MDLVVIHDEIVFGGATYSVSRNKNVNCYELFVKSTEKENKSKLNYDYCKTLYYRYVE